MIMLPDPQDYDDGWVCPPVDPDEFAHHLAMWAECPASIPALRDAVHKHSIVPDWLWQFAEWGDAYDGPDWCDILEDWNDV